MQTAIYENLVHYWNMTKKSVQKCIPTFFVVIFFVLLWNFINFILKNCNAILQALFILVFSFRSSSEKFLQHCPLCSFSNILLHVLSTSINSSHSVTRCFLESNSKDISQGILGTLSNQQMANVYQVSSWKMYSLLVPNYIFVFDWPVFSLNNNSTGVWFMVLIKF